MAGSFIATVVQYFIAVGLGVAATVEAHVNKGGSDVVLGYRGAYWLGIGFAAAAFFVVVLFVRDHRFDGKMDAEMKVESSGGTVEEASGAKGNA